VQVKAAPIDNNGVWGTELTMSSVRTGHTATLLSSGNVLLAGGAATANTVTGTAQIYSSSNGSLSPAGGTGLGTPRADHQAVLLSSGVVLVVGGDDRAAPPISSASGEFYDPQTDKFFAGPTMLTARKQFVAVPLTASSSLSGSMLIAGGTGLSSATTTPAEILILP